MQPSGSTVRTLPRQEQRDVSKLAGQNRAAAGRGTTPSATCKLLNRVRRIRGQMEAVERAVGDEADCAETLQRIAAVRGALNGLMVEVIGSHMRRWLVGSAPGLGPERAREAEQLITVLRAYLK